jgi:predicted nucleic acid-binding protein
VSVIRKLQTRSTWSIGKFYAMKFTEDVEKESASTPSQAWAQISGWLSSPTIRLLSETDEFAALLEGFLILPHVRGPMVHDARIAALCVAHGVETLLTRDRDFSLFSELRTRNPFE